MTRLTIYSFVCEKKIFFHLIKFLALGTHDGVVHILDHQGNHIRNKKFPSHTTIVHQISIERNGEYLASCSGDGRVNIRF